MSLSKHAVGKLKGIAIAAVVILHFTNDWHSYFSNPTWELTWFSVNQILRFCVPLFVALSGYALAIKYAESTPKTLPFIKNRAKKLLPLFIVWVNFLIFLGWIIPELRVWEGSINWRRWMFGLVDYHLYFVPMIFQLYFLFPFIFRLFKSSKKLVLLLTFAVQFFAILSTEFLVLTSNAGSTWWTDQNQYVWGVFWIFYFVLGIALAKYKIERKNLIYLPLFTLLSAFWVVFDSYALWKGGQDIILATRFSRLSVLAFATSVILFVTHIPYMNFSFPKFVGRPALFMGKWSYVIYLTHTLFLRVFDKVIS